MATTDNIILSYIPQRPPFVMVDSLTYSDDQCSRSEFLITGDNILVLDGKLMEAGMIENIAQTAAARAGYNAVQENKPVQLGFIGAIKNLEVFEFPQVDDLLETEVVMQNQVFDVSIVIGTVKCKGKLLAQCEMRIFIIRSE